MLFKSKKMIQTTKQQLINALGFAQQKFSFSFGWNFRNHFLFNQLLTICLFCFSAYQQQVCKFKIFYCSILF